MIILDCEVVVYLEESYLAQAEKVHRLHYKLLQTIDNALLQSQEIALDPHRCNEEKLFSTEERHQTFARIAFYHASCHELTRPLSQGANFSAIYENLAQSTRLLSELYAFYEQYLIRNEEKELSHTELPQQNRQQMEDLDQARQELARQLRYFSIQATSLEPDVKSMLLARRIPMEKSYRLTDGIQYRPVCQTIRRLFSQKNSKPKLAKSSFNNLSENLPVRVGPKKPVDPSVIKIIESLAYLS